MIHLEFLRLGIILFTDVEVIGDEYVEIRIKNVRKLA
jgi:hypothetical protein